jgi:hypothetical protein
MSPCFSIQIWSENCAVNEPIFQDSDLEMKNQNLAAIALKKHGNCLVMNESADAMAISPGEALRLGSWNGHY